MRKTVCGRPVARTTGCQGTLERLTDHLYRCEACGALQWRRPRSKHFPEGVLIVFGYSDEHEENDVLWQALHELIERCDRLKRSLDHTDAIAQRDYRHLCALTAILHRHNIAIPPR